jgi:8-oxo-dGTP pyrophosphatase MutT (NUDIX family)
MTGSPGGNPWRTIGSRVVYRNDWITVREDEVIRPDGVPGIYGVVRIAPSVGIVAVDDAGRVALVSQWRYALGRPSLEIPTGGSEPGDTSMLDAARRELREETGVLAQDWTALGTIDNSNGVTDDVAHLFVATGLTVGPDAQDGQERIELVWLPLPEAIDRALDGRITESASVAALLKVELLGRRGLLDPE